MGPLAGAIAAQVALGLRPDLDLAAFSPTGS
jgi:glycine/D-amino acid oxidase-like deaminating enzyme